MDACPGRDQLLGPFPRRRQKCLKCARGACRGSGTSPHRAIPPCHQPRACLARPAQEAWGPCARHQPRPARPTAAPRALAHVCVPVRPLLCRETVTVTQSKQVIGHRGHSYATFSMS